MRRKSKRKNVEQYIHDDEKRLNNPPVGLVTAETDHLNGQKIYQFDPHLDPQLQWAGKTEGTSFGVDTVSLHVHERIDPLTIIQAIKRRELQEQRTLFSTSRPTRTIHRYEKQSSSTSTPRDGRIG